MDIGWGRWFGIDLSFASLKCRIFWDTSKKLLPIPATKRKSKPGSVMLLGVFGQRNQGFILGGFNWALVSLLIIF